MCTIELLVLFLVLKTAACRRHIFEVVDSVLGMQQRVSLYSHKEAQVPELSLNSKLCSYALPGSVHSDIYHSAPSVGIDLVCSCS